VFSSAGPPVGAAVSFTLGSVQSSPVGQSCAGTTDSNGEASCTVVVNEPSGNWVIRATVIGNDFYDVSSTSATFTISVPPPTMTYTGATAGDYNDPAALSATLSDTGLPVAGAQLTFVLGTQACTAVTNASGAASCNVTPNVGAGTYPLAVSFAGTANILPSSTSATFTVTREETSLAYTGVSGPVGAGSTVTLSAVLKEDGVSAIGGRTVTLSFGAQTCSASTNAAGLASCTVTVSQPTGPVGITASFAGDTFYQPATASSDALVYGSAGGGAFVIGDGSAAGAVMFWGAQWSRANALSGRAASPSFKGYATAAAGPACGATWTTGPGNSPTPPATIPQYIAVIVASSTAKNGPAISGNTVSVVIVRTNPGYGPDPSQTGTGTVVATICH
jgi:hypothetical protein